MLFKEELLARLSSVVSAPRRLEVLQVVLGIYPEYLTSSAEYFPANQIQKSLERISKMESKYAVFFDFDETLANVRPVYVFVYLMIQYMLGIDDKSLDTYDQLVGKGAGSDNFAKMFGEVGDEFQQLHNLILQSYGVNFHLQPLPPVEHESMLRFVEQTQKNVAGILTTRPSSKDVIASSREYLAELFKTCGELADLPIITRDVYTWQMVQTNEYKIETLAQLTKETGKAMILIDDNDSMREMVSEYNKWLTADMPPIILIVYKNVEYQDKDWSEKPDFGIYSSDWQAMELTLSRVRSEWNL